ncbi:hypothetical protein COOONC_21316 [Cooperia oncophora]
MEYELYSVADALSRAVAQQEFDDTPITGENEKGAGSIECSRWLDLLRDDPDFQPLITAIELVCEDGTLATVVPRQCRKDLFHERHYGLMAGHLNSRKMHSQLKKTLRAGAKNVKNFLINTRKISVPPLKPRYSTRPFHVIGVDVVTDDATPESPNYLLHDHELHYPSNAMPTSELSLNLVDYDQYKTEFLNGLKLARECSGEYGESYRQKMAAQYDKMYKSGTSEVFKPGDRVYMRLQFYCLIQTPPEIDYTPIKCRTRRGKRGRPENHNCTNSGRNRLSSRAAVQLTFLSRPIRDSVLA